MPIITRYGYPKYGMGLRKRRRYVKRRSWRARVPGTRSKSITPYFQKSQKAMDMASKYATPLFKTGKYAIPAQLNVKLPYCEEVALDCGSGSQISHVFRANSLFDPDYTDTGHQPYGFDQYMGLYYYWAVQSSTIRVWLSPIAVADSVPAYLAVIRSGAPTTPTFASSAHFLEYCKAENIMVQQVGGFISASLKDGLPIYTCSAKFNVGKVLGTSTADSNSWGTEGGNPNVTVIEYYHLVLYAVQGNNPGAMNFRVEIDYDARFFQKKTLATS